MYKSQTIFIIKKAISNNKNYLFTRRLKGNFRVILDKKLFEKKELHKHNL